MLGVCADDVETVKAVQLRFGLDFKLVSDPELLARAHRALFVVCVCVCVFWREGEAVFFSALLFFCRVYELEISKARDRLKSRETM